MKAIIIVYVCVALLPSTIHGDRGNARYISSSNNSFTLDTVDMPDENVQQIRVVELNELDWLRIRLDQIATNGGNINRIFKPSTFLGRGASCIIYEGELLAMDEIVAMKFAPSDEDRIQAEYDIYTYMNAVDNQTVENYGIPAVYYYGRWEDYDMIAITLLDSAFHELQNMTETNWSDVDLLIIIREYVRISKYMHSYGVYHCDSRLKNMMFRRNKGFMIDFDLATKRYDWFDRDYKKGDWADFMFSVCELCGLDIESTTTNNTFRKINDLPDRGLKRVLLQFAYTIYGTDQVKYDKMHQMITDEIHIEKAQEPAFVSWLTDEQKREALDEWKRNPTPDIQSIPDPYATTEFDYPEPDYDYFDNDSYSNHQE